MLKKFEVASTPELTDWKSESVILEADRNMVKNKKIGFLSYLIIIGKLSFRLWFLYEQLLSVVQDFLLRLLDNDILHKDTLFLNEQLLCVEPDFFYMLLDADIAH